MRKPERPIERSGRKPSKKEKGKSKRLKNRAFHSLLFPFYFFLFTFSLFYFLAGIGFVSVVFTVVVCSWDRSTSEVMPPMSIFKVPSSLSFWLELSRRCLSLSNRTVPVASLLFSLASLILKGRVAAWPAPGG